MQKPLMEQDEEDGYVHVMIKKEALIELQMIMNSGGENMTPDKLNAAFKVLAGSGLIPTVD